ncbi:Tubulin-specific chaperone D, C-terminal [Kalmanozyma brasiliensis GHG001]|nr:Tubulin-specific chaperone D, C-terminal [Kalmanozyma brasiliensis GHG001]EST09962.2 Tubulin-specific chaperone D, C-terminal [Kalmanozyma brasiliensis GHG001]
MVDDPSIVIEERELIRFERADEYLSLLTSLVNPLDSTSTSSTPSFGPDETLSKLLSILDEYQDQSHLLDPYLERIVSPPVEALQRHVRSSSSLPPAAVVRLSKLVYTYTKVRGYKTILHYFPHEVADLPATLSFLEDLVAADDVRCWELRYVCLLWLSLICMIPFDLAKFDRPDSTSTTGERIAAVAEHFIASPGKERDAAAVVLGRLFQRNDRRNQFPAFLSKRLQAVKGEDASLFEATGVLQALCEVLKTSEPAFVLTHLADLETVIDAYDTHPNSALTNDGLITKYKTKLTARLALKLLRPRARRHANKYHVLGHPSAALPIEPEDEDESDISESTEPLISTLLTSLQHKDTLVRYSAAKGLARLSDRLPTSFLTQVVDAILSLFAINVLEGDLSSVSEHTWQGGCLALAELSRRGLLFGDMLSEALPWVMQALMFDVRRGAHSVGSNVRDAACYVVWALARSNDVESIRPHAVELARRLVCVATTDRDVSIRRAASAAFQESVGRLGLFPRGIEVIRLTDFYAVSVRRCAVRECAVGVAAFEEYRGYLVDHLVEKVTVHWDPAMRRLGAQAVALIAMHDPRTLLPELAARVGKRVATSDNAVLHGTLLTLAELSRLSQTLSDDHALVGEEVRTTCFVLLDKVRPTMFRSLGAAPLLEAACALIGAAIPAHTTSSANETQTWEKILNFALARPEETVHIAVADTIAHLSRCVDISSKVRSTLQSWSTLTLPQQQSNALLLGAVDFGHDSRLLQDVVGHLMALTRPSTKTMATPMYSSNIEVRRNASDSLTRALVNLRDFAQMCTPDLLNRALQSLVGGLEDYATDQRGDVGSWVRLSCIAGLRDVLKLCRRHARQIDRAQLDEAVGGMWKQAAERIDHVRCAAGTAVLCLYRAYQGDEVRPQGYDVIEVAFGPLNTDESELEQIFKNPTKAFRAVTRLLLIPAYRSPILHGLVLSVGSKSDLGERIIGPALADLTASTSYTLTALLSDIFDLAKKHFGNNRLFIPAMHTVNLLLENGATHAGMDVPLARLLRMVLSNMGKVKSVPRLTAAATVSANVVLAIRPAGGKEELLPLLIKATQAFLTHEFPTVRARCAEQLFAVLSSSVSFDDEEGEEKMEVWGELEMVLLDTKWDSTTERFEEPVGVMTAALPRLLT